MGIDKFSPQAIERGVQHPVRKAADAQQLSPGAEQVALKPAALPEEFGGRLVGAKPKELVPQTGKAGFLEVGFSDSNDQDSIWFNIDDVSSTQSEAGKKSRKREPYLESLEYAAPGWADRLAMIDPEKDPEMNRLFFGQIMQDLENETKSGKVDTETANILTAILLLKANELKASSKGEQYGIREDKGVDIKGMELYHHFERMHVEARLNYLRMILTRFNFETGEKEEPNLQSSEMLSTIEKMQEHKMSRIRANNNEIEKQNSARFKQAHILDKALHLNTVKATQLAELKKSVETEARNFNLRKRTDDYAKELKKNQISEKGREKLLEDLTREYNSAMPEHNLTAEDVHAIAETRIQALKVT